MGILATIFGGRKRASDRDALDDYWYSKMPSRVAASGASVTIENAMTLSTVKDCIKVLSETVAALPLHLYERSDNGNSKAERHPLYDVINGLPNGETTAFEFWGQVVWDLATHGNHYSEIFSGPRGPVDQLVRFDPGCVSVSRLSDGSKRYEIHQNGRAPRYLVDGEVWHLKLHPHTSDGLLGTSPIWTGRELIGAALALQEYGARFFANDATPPAVITHPGNFKDDESKKNFLLAIKRWWGGKNKGSVGVLEYGMKMERVGVNNEEAQFLETRKQLNIELCQLWNMKPHKVGILDRATFSNIEHQGLEFVTDTIMPIVRLIEQAISRDLILAPGRYFAEFNLDALLRGDLESRYAAYAIGRNWGFLSTNDIRRKEKMNPVEGGDDDYLQPLNMVPAGQEVPSDAQDSRRRRRDDNRRNDQPANGGALLPLPRTGGPIHGASL